MVFKLLKSNTIADIEEFKKKDNDVNEIEPNNVELTKL